MYLKLSLLFLLISLTKTTSKNPTTTSLVFKGCSQQKFNDPSSSLNLNTLLNSLTTSSSVAKFNNSQAGEFSGLFQCRSDLPQSECRNCVMEIPSIVNKYCGNGVAGRIQLVGCYIRFESQGYGNIPGTQFLYKVCGKGQVSEVGFGDRLQSALSAIVNGVGNGTGFYTGDYQSVYVLGQCEADLGSSDCVDCVKNAVGRVQSDCGSSSSGQVYLQRCYISYNYNTDGVHYQSNSTGSGHDTQKLVAIVVGAVAGFGLLIAALLFLKSAFKKRDNKY